MENSERPKPNSLSYDELLQQNLILRHELEEFRSQESFIWNMFAETSRKFQVYSASIKAAVSSLLDHNIFWDASNQHEFLQTIDSSVDQVSEITALITLAFLAQANNLVLSSDFHMIQEVLSSSQSIAARKMPEIRLKIDFPLQGQPVFVDYEYLSKALVLLYEVLFTQSMSQPIRIVASERNGFWALDLFGASQLTLRIIDQMHRCKAQPESNEILSAENILKLHLMCEILHLQQISLDIMDGPEQGRILRLRVPTTVIV
jgi:hypothetical protein